MSETRIEAIHTQWSLVRRAHVQGKPEEADAARQLLVMRYATAVRKYLGGILRDTEQADELAQDVVVRMLRGDFAGADPDRGRFRDLLKTATRNLARKHWEKANVRRTVDAELNFVPAESSEDADWQRAWQMALLEHVWGRLQEDEQSEKGVPAYTVLHLRTQFPDESSEQLAQRLGDKLQTSIKPDAWRQMLRRSRVKFAELLVDEVRMGLNDPSAQAVEEELAAMGLLEYVAGVVEIE
ncbi:MAG: sigma-70 family RNA polymerase sigma factor [Planctomycetia bacterium]|nr:sigma-70 family RNA polymerase sigma factor [Planctomycetia bacterium]